MKKAIIFAAFIVIAVYGLYTFVNFYDKNMWYSRMRETPVERPHEQPLLIMERGTIPIEGGEELVRSELSKGILPAIAPSTQPVVAFGKVEYQTFCSHCHGDNLDGLGTVGQSFNPLPTNLTGPKVTQMTDARIFEIISYGTQRCPALDTSMTLESRNAVVHYVRSKQGQ